MQDLAQPKAFAQKRLFNLTVIVAALGYFVDIYDLLLFTVVREPSLRSMNVGDSEMLFASTKIINWQMIGLLLGGILWGILGDKRGRLSVLFGSILLYSLANFANSYVESVNQYALTRFIAGIGLAGELGAGITLVSELMPKENRGVGTSLVAGIGLFGAVVAYFTYQITDNWRLCYQIGGGLGILLLILRIGVAESGMFRRVRQLSVSRGDFRMFFNNGPRLRKYLLAILIGLPTWFVIGILVNLSNRFAADLYGDKSLVSGKAIMYAYVAIAFGDILSGLISQALKSRKLTLYIYYAICVVAMLFYFSPWNNNNASMYLACAALGLGTGYWAIFVTMGAEQFGTNLRATAATTIPNMVRGSLPLINLLFVNILQNTLHFSLVFSGIVTSVIVMVITLVSAYYTEDTFHKDLNYTE